MNDQELNSNLSKILEDIVGRNIDFASEVRLEKVSGQSLVEIIEWNISGIAQPVVENLRNYDLVELEKNKEKREKKEKVKSNKLEVLSQAEIDELEVEDGMIVINSDTNFITYYINGVWR